MLDGRDGEYLCLGEYRLPAFGEFLELSLLLDEVNLVDDEEYGYGLLGHFLEESGVFRGVFDYVGDIDEDVGVGEGALAEIEHRLLQLVLGLQHTRGV